MQDGVYDAFAEKLAAKVQEMKVGPGDEPGVIQGPLINKAAIEKVEAHVKDALAKGAKILTGGKAHALGGTFYRADRDRRRHHGHAVRAGGDFRPGRAAVPLQDRGGSCRKSPTTRPSALPPISTRATSAASGVSAERLEFGIIGINEGIISTELAPFGGVKESGLGREGSHHGIEEFVEIKYMFLGGLES